MSLPASVAALGPNVAPPPRPTSAGGQLAQSAGALVARAAITPLSPEVTVSPSEPISARMRSLTVAGSYGTTRSEGSGTPAQAARNAAVAVANRTRDVERMADNDHLQGTLADSAQQLASDGRQART